MASLVRVLHSDRWGHTHALLFRGLLGHRRAFFISLRLKTFYSGMVPQEALGFLVCLRSLTLQTLGSAFFVSFLCGGEDYLG